MAQKTETSYFLHEVLVRLWQFELQNPVPFLDYWKEDERTERLSQLLPQPVSVQANNVILRGIRSVRWTAIAEFADTCHVGECTFCTMANNTASMKFRTRDSTLRLSDLIYGKRQVLTPRS